MTKAQTVAAFQAVIADARLGASCRYHGIEVSLQDGKVAYTIEVCRGFGVGERVACKRATVLYYLEAAGQNALRAAGVRI